MAKKSAYHLTLPALSDWDSYLRAESGLPGPRANLELVQAAADLGRPDQFRRWLALDAKAAPPNTPSEFLRLCGAVGLGRLLAEGGDPAVLAELRRHASDPRWRVREGVAMALQRWGEADMSALITAMKTWSRRTWLEQRAAAAALCEPRLLALTPKRGQPPCPVIPRARITGSWDETGGRSGAVAPGGPETARVLRILDTITAWLAGASPTERKDGDYRVLRQAMGYCWSVAIAAAPDKGKPALEKWLTRAGSDPDLRWVLLENLKKKRLERADQAWVARWRAKLG